MEHQTTIKIGIHYEMENFSKAEIAEKLEKIKNFALKRIETYEFEFLFQQTLVKSGVEIEKMFNDFIAFVENNAVDKTEDEIVTFSELGDYQSESVPDLESGEIEFSNSLNICDEMSIVILMNTVVFYASEISQFDNEGIGVSVEMNDNTGDYFEFEI